MLEYSPDGVGYFGKICELYVIESLKDKCIKKLIEELRQL